MLPAQSTLFDLSSLCALKVLGENATSFLQGQLSCDVEAVNANTMRQSAFCNLKGRVLALPDVLQFHNNLHLILPKNLLEKTEKSLSKTAILSRVTLEAETNYHLLGFYLQDTTAPLPIAGTWPSEKYAVHATENACVYHLGEGFYILLVHNEVLNNIKQENTLASGHAWHQLRLAQGEVTIYPESRGIFLPHRLGLHTSGHLNFNKGCYRGQEIIARTHYRAKLKYAPQCFIIETDAPLHPGLRLMSEDNKQEIGELADFAVLQNNQYLIMASVLIEHPKVIQFENYAGSKVELVGLDRLSY